MNEIWKDIPGYEGRYQASDQGRVRSLPFLQRYLLRNGVEAFRRTHERILALHPNNSGYLLVHLYLDNVRNARTVHRIVAELFVPNPHSLPEVNHDDGLKLNCSASNLEWCTSSENNLHALNSGLLSRAVSVIAPSGARYPSINAATRGERVHRRTVRTWSRA